MRTYLLIIALCLSFQSFGQWKGSYQHNMLGAIFETITFKKDRTFIYEFGGSLGTFLMDTVKGNIRSKVTN